MLSYMGMILPLCSYSWLPLDIPMKLTLRTQRHREPWAHQESLLKQTSAGCFFRWFQKTGTLWRFPRAPVILHGFSWDFPWNHQPWKASHRTPPYTIPQMVDPWSHDWVMRVPQIHNKKPYQIWGTTWLPLHLNDFVHDFLIHLFNLFTYDWTKHGKIKGTHHRCWNMALIPQLARGLTSQGVDLFGEKTEKNPQAVACHCLSFDLFGGIFWFLFS